MHGGGGGRYKIIVTHNNGRTDVMQRCFLRPGPRRHAKRTVFYCTAGGRMCSSGPTQKQPQRRPRTLPDRKTSFFFVYYLKQYNIKTIILYIRTCMYARYVRMTRRTKNYNRTVECTAIIYSYSVCKTMCFR